MAAVLGPYSHSHFQSLPALDDAYATLTTARAVYLEKTGEDLIHGRFKGFFVNAGMDRRFGLSMLHRHFDIGCAEKLVEYGGTSTPWVEIPGMKNPQPSIWGFDKDKQLKPTEFRYSGNEDAPLNEKDRQFAAAFYQELEKFGLAEHLGLSRYPGDDFEGSCEITQGNVNINLKPVDFPDDLQQIDTIWYFSAPLRMRGCRCTCLKNNDRHEHGTHVITVSG